MSEYLLRQPEKFPHLFFDFKLSRDLLHAGLQKPGSVGRLSGLTPGFHTKWYRRENTGPTCFSFLFERPGAKIACWLERWTRNRKVASSNPGRSGG